VENSEAAGSAQGANAIVRVGSNPSTSVRQHTLTVKITNPVAVSVSTNFTVIQIKTKTVSAYPANQESRRIVGVAEDVEIKVWPSSLTANWDTTAGKLDNDSNVSSVTFTAPHDASSATVKAKVSDPEAELDVPFNIQKPTGVSAVPYGATGLQYDIGKAGAGMHIEPLILMPTTVSFYKLKTKEMNCSALNPDGYFTNAFIINTLSHNPLSGWHEVDEDNKNGFDTARTRIEGFPKPWSKGEYTWKIPVKWRVGDDETTQSDFPSLRDQVFEIEADGTVRVKKFGKTATRPIKLINSAVTP